MLLTTALAVQFKSKPDTRTVRRRLRRIYAEIETAITKGNPTIAKLCRDAVSECDDLLRAEGVDPNKTSVSSEQTGRCCHAHSHHRESTGCENSSRCSTTTTPGITTTTVATAATAAPIVAGASDHDSYQSRFVTAASDDATETCDDLKQESKQSGPGQATQTETETQKIFCCPFATAANCDAVFTTQEAFNAHIISSAKAHAKTIDSGAGPVL